jgi:hypothetical protein
LRLRTATGFASRLVVVDAQWYAHGFSICLAAARPDLYPYQEREYKSGKPKNNEIGYIHDEFSIRTFTP